MPDHPVAMRDQLSFATTAPSTDNLPHSNKRAVQPITTIKSTISSIMFYVLAYTISMIVLAFVTISVAQIMSISAPLWIAWLVGVVCAAAVYEAWWEIGGW
ncbi:hypothetical protein HBI56_129440 [Parastagonospora nodorum]|uniref:Uncharacterized protein n=1 Tax=Phaeosphaeria nodorum (strain SN15 / ATCC MYA-4574 / FGSC 10173) TaxID=321614 RepID=A0A7U2HZB7_PHANO|nr:hypothetical protein HBH56_154380 [Parastagonospora nodorum]QRC95939.1 hypothetical protein JI435_303880 [Parastagonospora nodorum SN15]KAH3926654.1 hypothetical protein HBH54_163310 [Parastagonospora nodorum]KAH3943353.1 hypothetical protein HBH53_175910 [Parastagonospora nodorum]KAH3970288.1 hypothetical protein HBH52_167560 [Parastagonospora nodorum]